MEAYPPTAADYAQAAADNAKYRLDELGGPISLRDYFAAQAPIDAKMVLAVWGDESLAGPPSDDRARASFMAVWALLRYEYADAMLEHRKQ
jgi:hypothetical protein